MTRVLLIHHTPHHFETLVAIYETLRQEFDVLIWSNNLDKYHRIGLLNRLEARIFTAGDEFDVSVFISYEPEISGAVFPPALWQKISSNPIVKILHRYYNHVNPDEIYLFPLASNAFIPMSSGVDDAHSITHSKKKRFLIQGNIEGRRNYSILKEITSIEGEYVFYIVGKRVADVNISSQKVEFFYDKSEIEFRDLCTSCDFILPMIDPVGYKQYFTDRFSSSVQAGYSFSLPFIAHKRLFDLYPISGLAYDDTRGLKVCVQTALEMSSTDYAILKKALITKRDLLLSDNILIFKKVISYVIKSQFTS